MAELYKFFNAVEIAPGVFDREYQESDFADYFGSLLSSGLINTDEIPGMVVSVEAGTLNTIISPGKAILKGHLYENTSPLKLAHNIPEATLNRIDRIVLRLDSRNQSRFIKLFVKEGVPSTTPVAPSLQRDNFIHELSLARVLVRANTVQLLASDLVDERLDENLCGLAAWNPKVPTGHFQKQWDEFMAGIVDSGFASTESVTAVSNALTTHKAEETSHVYYADDTGTANAKAIAISPVPTVYKKGLGISFTNKVLNTGAVTINVNGLGAKAVLKSNGSALTSGNLKANSIYTVRYNGTSFILQGEGGEYGTATADDVRIGKTLATENGIVNGVLSPLILAIGDNLKIQASTLRTTVSLTPVKLKEIKWTGPPATVRVTYDHRSNNDAIITHSRIYINGVARGIQRDRLGSTFLTYTTDIQVNTDDLIQLYVWTDHSSYTAYIQNYYVGVLIDLGTVTQN